MQTDLVKRKIDQFLSKYRKITFKKGEIILRPYDEIVNCYYIKSGLAFTYANSATGSEFTTNIFRPNSIVVLSAAISENTVFCTCEALTPVVAIKVPSRDMRQFMQSDSQVAYYYFEQFASALSQTCVRMEAIMFGTAHEKVASVLCLLHNRFQLQNNQIRLNLNFSLTHRQLASMSGLTRETVSGEMMKLKKDKVIDYKSGKIDILDLEELRDRSSVGHYFAETI